MPSENIGHVVANSLLMVANLFSALKITKLSVPDLVQTNSTLTLDCEYSSIDDRFSLQWLFNNKVVYEWRPGSEPAVQGILQGRLDQTYKVSEEPLHEHRALRIVSLQPEMSGDYTCAVKSDAGVEDRLTKTLLVFSPEHEFFLTINYDKLVEINCIARGLYPQPSLILERNRDLIPKQDLRVWRNDSVYDASGSGSLMTHDLRDKDRITCRLMLPQAGYTAMREMAIDISCTLKNGAVFSSMPGALAPRCVKNLIFPATAENQCRNSAQNILDLHVTLGFCIVLTKMKLLS